MTSIVRTLYQKRIRKVLGQGRGSARTRVEKATATDMAKEPVCVLTTAVVEAAALSGALDTASHGLANDNVRHFFDLAGLINGVLGRLRWRGLELVDVQRDGGSSNGLAQEEADALQAEDSLKVARQRFVLETRELLACCPARL